MEVGDEVTFAYNKLSCDVGKVIELGERGVTVEWELHPGIKQTYWLGEVRVAREGEADHRRKMRKEMHS